LLVLIRVAHFSLSHHQTNLQDPSTNGATVVSTSNGNTDMCWYWRWRNTNITQPTEVCGLCTHKDLQKLVNQH